MPCKEVCAVTFCPLSSVEMFFGCIHSFHDSFFHFLEYFFGLVDVSEVQILSICQVSEGCGVEVSPFKTTGFLCLYLVASMVFSFHKYPEGDYDAYFDEVAINRELVSRYAARAFQR